MNTPFRSLNGQRFDRNIAFFIPVNCGISGGTAGTYLLRSVLGELDREDAVFTTAKLNLIVFRPATHCVVHWLIRMKICERMWKQSEKSFALAMGKFQIEIETDMSGRSKFIS